MCEQNHRTESVSPPASLTTSQSVEWYVEGQSRTVEVAGVEITVRFVGRKGRRARIAITAPGGAVFRSSPSR